MEKGSIITLKSGKNVVVLEKVELNNFTYLLCENIEISDFVIYKTLGNDVSQITDLEELEDVFNAFLNIIPGLNEETILKLKEFFKQL